jgi:hypothetical protein
MMSDIEEIKEQAVLRRESGGVENGIDSHGRPGSAGPESSPRGSSDVEKQAIPPTALTWDSPEDPDNPRNWPFGKKAYHTVIPALFGFVM